VQLCVRVLPQCVLKSEGAPIASHAQCWRVRRVRGCVMVSREREARPPLFNRPRQREVQRFVEAWRRCFFLQPVALRASELRVGRWRLGWRYGKQPRPYSVLGAAE